MKWPWPKLVRTRVTLWYVFLLGVLLVASAIGASFILAWQMTAQLKRHAVQDLETIEGLLYFRSSGQIGLHDDYHNHVESKLVQDRYVEIMSPDGTILYRNKKLGNATLGGAPFLGEGVGGYSERSTRASDGTSIVLASRVHLLEGRPILIRLAYSQDQIWNRLKNFWILFFLALPVALLFAAVAGFRMVDKALNPISQMVQRAEQITTERLHERLPVESNDELGNLGRVFNQMLSRIEQSFEQLRRFTADASHELRTPLASIRAVGEVGLHRDATPEEYRDIIGSMLEEINRLTGMIDSLLMLSRADAGQIPIKMEVFSLAEVMQEAASLLEMLMQEKEQSFSFESGEEVLVRGDRLILRQAAINILHNAVKFTPAGGKISARISCGDSCIVMSVTDNGPGISTEHLTKVFDRFYRVDPARADGNKGAGLGLSIASWAARAHNGEIGLAPAPGGGCTFWIRIPSAFPLTSS
jgi:heavy metal sensor kinase